MVTLLLLGLSSVLARAANTWEEGSAALLGFDGPANTGLHPSPPLGLESKGVG